MDRLEFRVALINKINQAAMDVYQSIREVLVPYVGKKITTADCYLMKRIKEKMPALPDSSELRIMFNKCEYNVSVNIRAGGYLSLERGQERFLSEEITLYVGSVRDCVLTELEAETPAARKADWKADDIRAARAAVEAAKEVVSKASENLGPFGEYDRY